MKAGALLLSWLITSVTKELIIASLIGGALRPELSKTGVLRP